MNTTDAGDLHPHPHPHPHPHSHDAGEDAGAVAMAELLELDAEVLGATFRS